MGLDSVQPFLDFKDKLSFILGLTSNPSATNFEKQRLVNGRFLYQEVIHKTNSWNVNNNCGLVFGATNLDELKENIESFNDMPVLLPGVGAQGGSFEDVVNTFHFNDKKNYIINISRGLIYIDKSKDFGEKIKATINGYNSKIKNMLE